MKIVADENIPYINEFFDSIADVTQLNGRTLSHRDLIDADALIIRSVTPVTRALLENTKVRFVGTCTIGIDHVDTDYLDEKGIAFASAPGSNADSAAQYVISAIITLAMRHGFDLSSQTLGIIGFGNVGTRVAHIAKLIGMKVIVNDPPLTERGISDLVSQETLLTNSDIITFHVPLTLSGKHQTLNMIDANFLANIRKNAILINSSRGGLIDINAMKHDIQVNSRRIVLDVWPNEPRIDEELLSMVQLATPHIAGYSLDGKIKGTEMIYDAYCQSVGVQPQKIDLNIDAPEKIQLDNTLDLRACLQQACLSVYDIAKDDYKLRGLLEEPPENQGAYFDRLRKHYPARREYASCICSSPYPSELAKLGFKTN